MKNFVKLEISGTNQLAIFEMADVTIDGVTSKIPSNQLGFITLDKVVNNLNENSQITVAIKKSAYYYDNSISFKFNTKTLTQTLVLMPQTTAPVMVMLKVVDFVYGFPIPNMTVTATFPSGKSYTGTSSIIGDITINGDQLDVCKG